MTELRIMASRHSAFYSPLLCTMAGGFLERHGLQGTYRPSQPGEATVAEVAAGRMDVGQSAVSASWGALERGQPPPVAHFAQINSRDGFFIAAREPTQSFDWGQLLTGEFIYVHGGQPEAMLRYAAYQMGVDLARVKGIDLGGTTEMMAAWRAGRGNFFHEQGAYPQQLAYEGHAHIVASVGEVIGPVAFSSLICRWDWLETDTARRFTDAYRAARHWVNTAEPDAVARAVAGFFPDQAPAAIADAIAAYQALGCWSGEIAIEAPLYEKALDVFAHGGRIARRHRYDDVVVRPPAADG